MDLGVRSAARMPARRGERGFTLIEALVATVILLVVSLGVLPLFMRSIVDNAVGRESTELTNYARSTIEQYSQFDFFSAELTVIAGTTLVTDEYFKAGDREWYPGTVPGGTAAMFTRTVTVRQFGASALADGVLADDEALDAATSIDFVHLKEIAVAVVATRELESLGPSSQITLRLVRAI